MAITLGTFSKQDNGTYTGTLWPNRPRSSAATTALSRPVGEKHRLAANGKRRGPDQCRAPVLPLFTTVPLAITP